MRTRLAVAMMIVAVLCLPGLAHAQMPWIGVFFDSAYQDMNESAPVISIDSLYIALVGANAFVSGVEFSVSYPAEINFIADFDKQPVTIGTTATGFSQGWAIPPNGFSAVYVCGVQFMWTVNGCPNDDSPIVVLAHPDTGFLGFTDFPGYTEVPAVGMTSLVCATVPADESTWGRSKSLYSE